MAQLFNQDRIEVNLIKPKKKEKKEKKEKRK
jgi:hypothetical protein